MQVTSSATGSDSHQYWQPARTGISDYSLTPAPALLLSKSFDGMYRNLTPVSNNRASPSPRRMKLPRGLDPGWDIAVDRTLRTPHSTSTNPKLDTGHQLSLASRITHHIPSSSKLEA
ncbi:hypothetical protein PGT21_030780 [Puccinia graminis f. sp. tritici]|uniref:Uncharacterized protein n=1 Tax=Puccinia graminis f. sp. tritici TaxID=56615 RepID=A0A5B0Q718_PUCGR|nr:hypothetical protein PGT21_030780 [Puccinia graminis f. sp. tritici]KAA1122535.1 hypothetical protein PGTUg99_037760 [Puccinia graminis f. sp. tritici]